MRCYSILLYFVVGATAETRQWDSKRTEEGIAHRRNRSDDKDRPNSHNKRRQWIGQCDLSEQSRHLYRITKQADDKVDECVHDYRFGFPVYVCSCLVVDQPRPEPLSCFDNQ